VQSNQLSPIGADMTSATSVSLSIYNLLLYGLNHKPILAFYKNYIVEYFGFLKLIFNNDIPRTNISGKFKFSNKFLLNTFINMVGDFFLIFSLRIE